jgi:hypothetical protein
MDDKAGLRRDEISFRFNAFNAQEIRKSPMKKLTTKTGTGRGKVQNRKLTETI